MPKHILRKSQIQLAESTTIVLIIIILIVIGFGFYAYLKAENLKKDKILFDEYEDIQLTLTASNVPELLCSHRGVVDNNCYDWLKVKSLATLIASKDPAALFYYTDYFGSSIITISKMYPLPSESIMVYNNTRDGDYSNKTIPILIYDPVEQKNYFGLITIGRQAR